MKPFKNHKQTAQKSLRGKMPLKYILISSFLLFAAVMILLLWLFQTVFLDSFYKSIKTSQIKACASSIAYNVGNENIDELADLISQQNDMNICIYDTTNSVYFQVYTSEGTGVAGIKNIKDHEIYAYYKKAVENGGTMFEIVDGWEHKGNFLNGNDIASSATPDGGKFNGDNPPLEKSTAESMAYAQIITSEKGNEYLIFLNSLITPITSTVETLRVQLIIITWILFALCIVLAFVVSRAIANPIIKMNNNAKELAKQNYDVNFEGGDYREIAELNKTLNYAMSELSKVESLRKELIANVSHDLRTPLTMIIGYGEVIRDLPGENTPENVQIIIDEATHLSVLVNDMLDISKLQAGAIVLEKSEFSLSDCVDSIFIRYSKLIEQDGYNIHFEHNGDAYINGDEIKITQVIYNLMNNAINYAGEDKTVIVRQIIEPDNKVTIQVEDHGKGIEQDKLEYIWDRYYKVDKSHKSSVIGTGLGLSIVKNILDMHGATYGVKSKVGEGSIFWFTIDYSAYSPSGQNMLAASSIKANEQPQFSDGGSDDETE